MQTSPAWMKLGCWQSLPGSAAVLEVMIRNQESSPQDPLIRHLVQVVMLNLAIQAQQQQTSPSSCAAHISLVASAHKLLLLHTAIPEPTTHTSGSSDVDQVRETLACTEAYMHDALGAMLAQLGSSGTLPSSKDSTAASEAAVLTPSAVLPGSSSGAVQNPGCAEPCGSLAKSMHQLRAIMVMILVWVERWVTRGNPKGGQGEAKGEPAAGFGWSDELQAHDPELASLACQLSLPSPSSRWKTESAAVKQQAGMWETYALHHFHGRLLPGCSHLRCTNMAGTRERALPTLLCSGCRRVRYCCVACQRAAWVLGGHSEVCGKGAWAASDAST